MAKCMYCSELVQGRAKTCSDKCRKALSRMVDGRRPAKSVTQTVTNTKCDKQDVSQLHPAIKAGIERISVDEEERGRRLSIALNYQ